MRVKPDTVCGNSYVFIACQTLFATKAFLYVYFLRLTYTNPWYLVARATKFCKLSPNICGSSVWKLVHVTVPAPRILSWLPDFWKICATLSDGILSHHHTTTINTINLPIIPITPFTASLSESSRLPWLRQSLVPSVAPQRWTKRRETPTDTASPPRRPGSSTTRLSKCHISQITTRPALIYRRRNYWRQLIF